MPTTVINKRSKEFVRNSNQIYIRRGSPWGNPSTHLPLSRTKAQFQVATEEESIIRYEAWLRERLEKDPTLRQRLLALDGHELVCYCKPRPCHGDILVKVIEELKHNEMGMVVQQGTMQHIQPRRKRTMIISVSKRTDIPAFYGEWFLNRLDAGYCMVRNPKAKPYRVSLRREDVDGFVFWTKDISPFMGALATVHQRVYPFYVLHTINNYPASLEPNVRPFEESARNMHTLRDNYGPDAAVWRYDPIVITPGMPAEWHVANFRRLAEALRGTTNEVVISFVDIACYMHVQRHMAGVKWSELATEEKSTMASQLAAIAKEYGMQLTMCCERGVQPAGTRPSHCVDADRIARVAGRPITAKPGKSRPGCGCVVNRDIGDYDTCVHGCKYCYATASAWLAKRLHGAHDARTEMLIPLVEGSDTERISA